MKKRGRQISVSADALYRIRQEAERRLAVTPNATLAAELGVRESTLDYHLRGARLDILAERDRARRISRQAGERPCA